MSAGAAARRRRGGSPRPVPAADLALAVWAALRAGPAALRWFGRETRVEYKAPDQPLTEADLEADRAIADVLRAARPDDGWLSEETVDRPDRLSRERVWIVDPIDGTRSFIAVRPEFTICVGLAVAGEVAVGAVYNPATGELYGARRGGGAWLGVVPDPRNVPALPSAPERLGPVLDAAGVRERRPLAVTERGTPEGAVLLASRSEIARGEFQPFRGEWRVEPEGSTAYKMVRVAAGRGDAFLSRGPKSEWDVCAAALIVTEAGGRATDLDGRTLRFNRPDPYVHGIVAANGRLHDALVARVHALLPTGRLRAPSQGGDDARRRPEPRGE